MTHKVEGFVRNNPVSIEMGDITQTQVDAIVVPQFATYASRDSVAWSVANSGAAKGIEAYEDHVRRHGPQEFGTVVVTPAYGGPVPNLIHAVSVDSGAENEFSTIQNVMFAAMVHAAHHKWKKIAVPALGTGWSGTLNYQQSAEAMMAGIHEYNRMGGPEVQVSFVIYDHPESKPEAYKVFKDILWDETYAPNWKNRQDKKPAGLCEWLENSGMLGLVNDVGNSIKAGYDHFKKRRGLK